MTVDPHVQHVGYMTCWASTREPPYKRVGSKQVRVGWIAPTGVAHAFVIGRTFALCGAERAYDNGQAWPPPAELASEGLCPHCVVLSESDPTDGLTPGGR